MSEDNSRGICDGCGKRFLAPCAGCTRYQHSESCQNTHAFEGRPCFGTVVVDRYPVLAARIQDLNEEVERIDGDLRSSRVGSPDAGKLKFELLRRSAKLESLVIELVESQRELRWRLTSTDEKGELRPLVKELIHRKIPALEHVRSRFIAAHYKSPGDLLGPEGNGVTNRDELSSSSPIEPEIFEKAWETCKKCGHDRLFLENPESPELPIHPQQDGSMIGACEDSFRRLSAGEIEYLRYKYRSTLKTKQPEIRAISHSATDIVGDQNSVYRASRFPREDLPRHDHF